MSAGASMSTGASMNTPVLPLVDNAPDDPTRRAPLVLGTHDFSTITDKVCEIVEQPRPPKAWYVAFGISATLAAVFFAMIGYLFMRGIGVWGLNIPVGWAFDITNFVFWVGIGHAGTLISAILFLFRQKWRTGINRFAEAMTIFAVMCAGVFPAIHIGRPWLAYWLFPIPNQMAMWPNFRSPLLWDVFAVSTYFIVSLLFWYVGMLPDLATLRDRATTKGRQIAYGVLAMGWTGSGRQWHHYERVYLLLAALATPLVLSVHSVVSFDFAASLLPGWHTTIFPPYFVAGAIFGGFAMVVTLLVPVRAFFKLEEIVTTRHLDNMAKIILATGTMLGYSYAMEFFTAWYSGNPTERFVFLNRAFGPYWWAYWTMITCNVVAPQLLWLRKFRQNPWLLLVVALFVNVGMWFERFVIIVTSLSRDFLPSSWGYFRPTVVDLLTLAGSFGFFLSLFLLFLRFVPMFAMAEIKSVMPAAGLDRGPHHGHGQYWGEIPHQHDGPASRASAPDIVQPRAGALAPPDGRTLLAEFDDVGKVLAVSERLRDAGFSRWDVHTPIPIHGLDEAMGIRMSKLPWIVLGGGTTGLFAGLALQWFTNAFDYPFLISGKPLFGLPAAVPVTFELTVLLASLGAVGGLFVVNGWPRLHNPLFASDRFRRATTDRFFVSVDQADPCFDARETEALLTSLGAVHVETVGE